MTGLRQRQMERRRQTILNAAQELFQHKGYSDTNVEEIAARAEVGVATIYKYFGAKGGLIRELWRPHLAEFRRGSSAVIAKPPASAGAAMAALMAQFSFDQNWQSRDLLRAIAGMELGYADIFQGIREELDQLILNQIKALLATLEAKGALAPGLDYDDIAFIIYGVFNEHFQYYLVHEEVAIEVVQQNLSRRIRLLFTPWVPA